MNSIRRIRRSVIALAALAASLMVTVAATPAFARLAPPDPPGYVAPASVPVQVRTIVAGGMPGWQIALIAAGAALIAAALAVLADRALAGRRRAVISAA
jgi:hypothetical protein